MEFLWVSLVLFNIKEIIENIGASREETENTKGTNTDHQHSEIKYVLREYQSRKDEAILNPLFWSKADENQR
jgi:hypothetical protein